MKDDEVIKLSGVVLQRICIDYKRKLLNYKMNIEIYFHNIFKKK